MTLRRPAVLLGGAVLLVLAGWLAYTTVHTLDGPWGRPGSPGTLTLTRCQTYKGGGGDPPTMSCTGTFTPDHGGSPVPGVRLNLDRVGPWAPGGIRRVWLPSASHTAYRPGGNDWLIRLGFFLFLLGCSIALIGTADGSRWARRVQVTGAVVAMSAFPVPLLVWLISLLG